MLLGADRIFYEIAVLVGDAPSERRVWERAQVEHEPHRGGAAGTIGANGASSPRHQLLTDPGYNEPDTKSDAEARRVHCKIDPPRMSTWHPDLKDFK
jgi:hypothetical protein